MKAIKIMKQTLIDTFEVDGVWFKPSAPDKSVHGKLLFSHTHSNLKLFGSLTRTQQDPLGTQQSDDLNIIFGQTMGGELITLFDVFRTQNTFRSGGFPSQTFRFNYFVVGGHFASPDELVFNEASFNSTYLEDFIGASPITEEFDQKNNIVQKVTVSFAHPKIQEWKIPNLDATLKTHSNMQMDTSVTNVDIKYKALMKLIPDTPQNYNWYLPRLNKFLSLLSIFTGKEQFFKELYFKINNEAESLNKSFKVFFTQKDFVETSELSIVDSILLPQIRSNFGTYVTNWFQLYDDLESIYHLYLNTKFNGLYEEWKFLNFTRILEGYHRLKFTESTYCNPSDYESIKHEISEFLDKTLTDTDVEQLKKNIQGAISYAYEYPFAKRLTEIGKNLEKPIFDIIFRSKRDLNSFIFKVKETRNKLTHPQSQNQHIFQGFHLYLANVRLNAMIHSIILLDLGLPADFIGDKISYFHRSLIKAKAELK
ncbi:HEPN domain-containing protein [Bacillus toyonensis]|uniref:ApeA N-terminal domain 1-containing protein n=1 Tax=Bacillus toyonensis TaxID=155322 RepID=UPI00088836CC|nr:HEPN domain-containing protein [Bacillus toyonensis]PGB38773.1 hypothetical protein COM02_29395 [Bacillus toyonensis]SDK24784.1 hypothetical protein SAMN04487922_105323 [Bacillus toyonensis]